MEPERHGACGGTSDGVPKTRDNQGMHQTRGQDHGFESLLGLEETYQEEGASLAASTAAESGFEEGRALGWASGSQLAAELAFYAGAAATLDRLDLPPRARAAVDALTSVTQEVKLHEVGNSSEVDFEEHVKVVRERFRSAVAIAGLHRVRFDGEKSSKLTDLSF